MRTFKFLIILLLVCLSTVQVVNGCICRRGSAIEFLKSNDTISTKGSPNYKPKALILKGAVLDNTLGNNLYSKSMGNGHVKAINIKLLEFWPVCALKFMKSDTVTVFLEDDYCSGYPSPGDTCLVFAENTYPYLTAYFCSAFEYLFTDRSDYIHELDSSFLNYFHEIDSIAKYELKSLGTGCIPEPSKYRDNRVKINMTSREVEEKKTEPIIAYLFIVSVLINIAFCFNFLRRR